MKKRKNTEIKSVHKTKRFGSLGLICWIIVPIVILILLGLDGAGIYSFNTERLIILGVGLVVVLLPFFSEVTVKNFSLKRKNGEGN